MLWLLQPMQPRKTSACGLTHYPSIHPLCTIFQISIVYLLCESLTKHLTDVNNRKKAKYTGEICIVKI